MREKHVIVRLNTILAALNMAEEDAGVFVESNRDFDKEGLRQAQKQYNRVLRAKRFFEELFMGSSDGCGCDCADCTSCDKPKEDK